MNSQIYKVVLYHKQYYFHRSLIAYNIEVHEYESASVCRTELHDLITPKFRHFNIRSNSLFWSTANSCKSHKLCNTAMDASVLRTYGSNIRFWNILFSNCSPTASTTSTRTPNHTPTLWSRSPPPPVNISSAPTSTFLSISAILISPTVVQFLYSIKKSACFESAFSSSPSKKWRSSWPSFSWTALWI